MDWTFYATLVVLAPFPFIMGVQDYPEKILNFLDRKRAEERRRLRHAIWIEHHGVSFLRSSMSLATWKFGSCPRP